MRHCGCGRCSDPRVGALFLRSALYSLLPSSTTIVCIYYSRIPYCPPPLLDRLDAIWSNYCILCVAPCPPDNATFFAGFRLLASHYCIRCIASCPPDDATFFAGFRLLAGHCLEYYATVYSLWLVYEQRIWSAPSGQKHLHHLQLRFELKRQELI